MATLSSVPQFDAILAAHSLIQPYIHRTPVFTSRILNEWAHGVELFFKCENFQKVGAFKARGAFNAVFSLSEDEAQRGVVTHSSGNHAAAVALAARTRGCSAYIVMPDNSPDVKKRAVQSYNAEIFFCGPTQHDREVASSEVQGRTGAAFIHPYDDAHVIAGQGTCAKELLEDIPNLDYILAPVSGGGLLAGTALAARAMRPAISVIGCEPEEADDAFRSLRDGVRYPAITPPRTIADGLRTSLGELNFPIIREYVSAIHTVSEEAIIRAMRAAWEILKIVVEPSCAVPLAVVLEGKLDAPKNARIGIILSGGNVDLEQLPWQKKTM